MLTYAFQELRHNSYEKIAGEKFDGIYDLFAEIIYRGISVQLKQGLHRSYVGHKDIMPTLRGRLDVLGTIKNYANTRRMLSCEFDE